MKRKLAAILAAVLLTIGLAGCSGEITVKQADIKVEPRTSSDTTYVYFRNGYKFSDVDIVRNEDGTITITITAIPPDKLYSD